jgi:hypothetical protein
VPVSALFSRQHPIGQKGDGKGQKRRQKVSLLHNCRTNEKFVIKSTPFFATILQPPFDANAEWIEEIG